jgi:undecaprenyl pyrophosphate synthase
LLKKTILQFHFEKMLSNKLVWKIFVKIKIQTTFANYENDRITANKCTYCGSTVKMYVFSWENWSKPYNCINQLMRLLVILVLSITITQRNSQEKHEIYLQLIFIIIHASTVKILAHACIKCRGFDH